MLFFPVKEGTNAIDMEPQKQRDNFLESVNWANKRDILMRIIIAAKLGA